MITTVVVVIDYRSDRNKMINNNEDSTYSLLLLKTIT